MSDATFELELSSFLVTNNTRTGECACGSRLATVGCDEDDGVTSSDVVKTLSITKLVRE